MTAAPLATVPPAWWSPHPSLARLTPPDRSGVGARIVLLRFEGACAGPTVLSAVGTRPPHDGSSSEPAFQCGSRGPRAAATKSTEWPNPRPGRDASTRPKGGREPTRGSSHAGPPTPVPTTSGRRVRRRVEGRSRLQHRVHDHRQLARDRDRGALEADLLLQLEAPAPQRAPFGTIRPKVFMMPRIWSESWIEMRSSWPRAPTSARASIGAYLIAVGTLITERPPHRTV